MGGGEGGRPWPLAGFEAWPLPQIGKDAAVEWQAFVGTYRGLFIQRCLIAI